MHPGFVTLVACASCLLPTNSQDRLQTSISGTAVAFIVLAQDPVEILMLRPVSAVDKHKNKGQAKHSGK